MRIAELFDWKFLAKIFDKIFKNQTFTHKIRFFEPLR